MRILVDVGNTSVKWQLRSDGVVVDGASGDLGALGSWLASLEQGGDYTAAVSCVRGDNCMSELRSMFRSATLIEPHFATSTSEFHGVTNAYASPEMLGVDRWLAILAVIARGEDSAIIIDAGTACTIDVLENGHHIGGYIFPGVALARDALIANTDRIRFSEHVAISTAPGASTAECVQSGVWLTLYAATREIIARAPSARVFITGGSAGELAALGVEGDCVQGLVFDGLDFWLNGS